MGFLALNIKKPDTVAVNGLDAGFLVCLAMSRPRFAGTPLRSGADVKLSLHIWSQAWPFGKLERSRGEEKMTGVGVKARRGQREALERAQAKNVSAPTNSKMEEQTPHHPPPPCPGVTPVM